MPTTSGLVTKTELIDAQLDTAHLGRVTLSQDEAGNPISTSTNRKGGVNKTLDALEAEFQGEIDDLADRAQNGLDDQQAEFDAQLSQQQTDFESALLANGWLSVGFWADDPTFGVNDINYYVRDNNTGFDYAPLTLPYIVDSTTNPDPEVLVGVELRRVNEVNDTKVYEAEDRALGVGVKTYRGENGSYVVNGDTIPVGYTHLAIPINGRPEDVAMSPIASGAVADLTETSATIGGSSVLFEPHLNTNTAFAGVLGNIAPIARTIKEILNFVVDTKFYLKYDGSDEGATINALIANVAASGVKRVIKFHAGELSSSVPVLVKSGNYDIEFDKNCKITFDAGIDGFVIGDEGASPFEGSIKNPWVIKSTLEESDNAYRFVNFTGEIHNPRQDGFAYAYTAKPTNSSRVAYSVIYNPRSRNHKRMIFLQPQDATSYVNSNTFIGGRAENFIADRLEYNALLDNQSGSGCQHNLIDGTIFEGYSGTATNCGNASIKCINGSDYNEFKHNRNEEYNNGWSETYGVIFDPSTSGNNYEDTYAGSSVSDLGDNNYKYPKGCKISIPSAGVETGNVEIVRNGAVSKPFLDLSDAYSPSGDVNFIKYYTPRVASRAGSLIDLETGYGSVFKVDDAGSLIPRDNFADLGLDASARYRDLFIVNSPTVGSDYRLKNNAATIPQELLDFAMSTELQQYQLKGGESGRTHYGIVITEDFLNNLSEVTDIDLCAAFCHSVFTDADGEPITKQIGGVSVGDLWMVRYTEWHCILLEAMRRKINSL